MRKFADTYLDVLPWSIRETGFHPEKSRVSESLFSLANEHMGVRAYFEEGYSGDTLIGSYVNGIFEELKVQKSYKGISDRVCFMVNTVDWLYTRIRADGETLDLAKSRCTGFVRSLDFRTGLLTRSFLWTTASGNRIEVRFERFLSMERLELGYQRITLTALDAACSAELETGLDFSVPHEVYAKNYWAAALSGELPSGAEILGETSPLGKRLHAAFVLAGGPDTGKFIRRDKFAGRRLSLALRKDVPAAVEKITTVCPAGTASDGSPDTAGFHSSACGRLSAAPSFEAALLESAARWTAIWDDADIRIDGDPENQQGIRFSIFQLEQTYRGRVKGANIGAKGLTGEFYNGNAFWDTEVYCLPFYLFTDPSAARSLLEFRYQTMDQAAERARELDCSGTAFPVATIDGTESCTLWQHASLQLQPTTSVAYALRHYVQTTGDTAFLAHRGAEMLIGIARFLATRVQWSERRQAWGYYCVMGPDEFQMMVNHNAYTNFMGARSLEYAADTFAWLTREHPALAAAVAEKTSLRPEEVTRWREIAAGMYIPRDAKNLLIEQHEGFFDLPHVDIKAIPPEEFPLYHTWSYDRIYRNDMIKQPDVLMLMFLHNSSFTREEKKANYEYYEPRCIHESSLSPSVHSILASELGKNDEASSLFRFATRIDLDDYNRNTREGLHMTAIAAAWMNIVYGFAGLRSDGERPVLDPTLPDAWKSYSFRLRYRGRKIEVTVGKAGTEVRLLEGSPLELEISGSLRLLTPSAETAVSDGAAR